MEEKNEAQTIERLAKQALVVEVDGAQFSEQDLKPILDRTLLPTLHLRTLTGLLAYLDSNIDLETAPAALIVVNDPGSVSCVTKIGTNKIRHTICKMELPKDFNVFPFAYYLEVEDFIIKLKSMFDDAPGVDTTDLKRLIAYASRLSVNNTLLVQDDGISQAATLNRGVSGALKDSQVAPCIVSLSPYRTFLEVEQPVSSFLFRMTAKEGQLPKCALFEADGGKWKNQAMENIAAYLTQNLTNKIPVIF